MKKIFTLLFMATLLSCSSDNDNKVASCNCTNDVQYYYIENGNTTETDFISTPITDPDCSLDGQTTTTDTPFNGGVIRAVATINCD